MADWSNLADDELARRGREFARRGQYAIAHDMLSEYCARKIAEDRPISASILAAYGLAIGMTGDIHEGIETCQRALSADRRNGEIWAAMARLSLHAGAKKKAVETITRGLALAPNSRALRDLHQKLGVRRSPAVSFLPRGNPVNVKLGRVLHRLRGRAKAKPA